MRMFFRNVEQFDIALTLTCIRKVPSSNPNLDINYANTISGVSSVPPGKCKDTPRLVQGRFLSNPFQIIIHQSPVYSMLYSLAIESAEIRNKINENGVRSSVKEKLKGKCYLCD
jgi:hypothetical protein